VLSLALYSPLNVQYIPEAIYQLRDKNYGLISQLLGSSVDTGIAEGVYLSVTCAEEAPYTTPDAIAAQLAMIGDDLRPYYRTADPLAVCALWNVPAAPPVANQAVTSGLPTLALSGEIDPVTPPSWSAASLETLSAGQRFVLTGLGHAVMASSCGATLIGGFLTAPSASAPSACVDALKPNTFAVLRLPAP
jgi:pimeloyl-ACP methyl ester carboxylesterase